MKRLTDCIARYIHNGTVENIAVWVGKRDTILFEQYTSKSGALDEHTLFDAASVTKNGGYNFVDPVGWNRVHCPEIWRAKP